MTEETLFERAVQLPAAERAGFLDRECGGKPELRKRVEALLAADAVSHAPIDHPVAMPERTGEYTPQPGGEPAKSQTTDHRPDEQAGAVIAGKYTLLEVIGEGGMGSVWRAKQSEPVKRFVAVKLIKAGMDSKQVLARFDAERQALALMDHPNIAKVLDGGIVGQSSGSRETSDLHGTLTSSATGRPYFVMELVKGTPITEYCDHHKLTPKARLELFVQACQAIQHAHQKGIIHRDIKPSNVLVALYDDKPVVKVIDFGVAKATGGTLTEATIDTGFGGVVGTPQYMSPEQATFNNLDIDTRSDVYALGVLLYELLAGSPPFSGDELKKKGFLEILRVVREEEPPRPSTKLSTADALPSLSANRGTEPKKLTGLLRNELDWIVMKALEKDRTRRYETANGFAADVQRYLAGEPIVAHPPSAAYRLKKFVRRNKGQVIAAGLVLLALVAGVVGTTLGMVEAKKQEAEAKRQEGIARDQEEEARKQEGIARNEAEAKELARAAEEKQRLTAEAEKKRADEEKRIAQAVKDFLQDKLLAQADTKTQADALLRAGGPAAEAKMNLTVRELLDRAAKELTPDKIEANFPKQPLVQADILLTVGMAYHGVGESATAADFLARAVELFRRYPDHPGISTTINNLANAYCDAGKLDLALPLYEEALELTKVKYGPDHPNTLIGMNNLAYGYSHAGKLDRALPLFEETLKLRKAKYGPDHISTLSTMNNLATGYLTAMKVDKALPLLEEAFKLAKAKLGPDHPDTITTKNNLSLGYHNAGKFDRSLQLQEESLAFCKAKFGPDHPKTLASMNNLASGYMATGKHNLAVPMFEETFKLATVKLGPDHPVTLTTMSSLATSYMNAKQVDKGLPLYEETLKLTKAKLGPDHPNTLSSMHNLASGYLTASKHGLALPLFEETLKAYQAKFGPDHLHTIQCMYNLALGYQMAGKENKALPLFDQTLKFQKAKLGPDHSDTITSMSNVAAGYWKLKRLDISVPLFEELLPLTEKKRGRQHLDTQTTVANLGVNYKDAGRVAEALPLLEEAYRASQKSPMLRWVGPQLLDAYAKAGKPAEAAKLIDELLGDARKALPKDSLQLAGQMTTFSSKLLQSKAFPQAEQLIRESLAIIEKKVPDAWQKFHMHSQLGGALTGQKKYADAEPLLLKGYKGLKAREKAIPPQFSVVIPEALDRLIELYTATNKLEEEKKYKELRAKYPPAVEKAPMPAEKK